MNQRIRLLVAFVCAFMLPFANIPLPPTAGVVLAAQQDRKGHANGVTSLVFSPDGSLLASVGRDSVIRLSNVATAQELRVLQGHEEPIRSVAFSPNGKLLASAGEDSKVFIWDVATGKLLQILSGHVGFIDGVAFSPDGTTIVSGSEDSHIILWDALTGKQRRMLRGHASAVTDVIVSPDGKTIASSSKDKTVKLWDIGSGIERRVLKGQTDEITSVAFDKTGTNLLSASADKTVRIWDPATGALRRELKGQTKKINTVAISPDGTTIASGSEDNSIELWNTSSGQALKALRKQTKGITTVAFSTDGATLASGSRDGTIVLWDVASGQPRVIAPAPSTISTQADTSQIAKANVAQLNAAPASTASFSPTDGPGGPILIITSAANKYSTYYTEILRNEGYNEFAVADIGAVSAATLSGYDVAILSDMALSGSQVSMFNSWVSAGGNLIAMHPDKQLASLLGLVDAGSTLANAYLLINTAQAPGNGLVNQTMQFHGTADRYTLNGATSVATLYTNASTATSNPAVSLRSVGSNGGHAAAFSFDLSRSIVYTRQGNPAWNAQERDGFTPIRSDDLFFGASATDPQADWVDLNKVAIPQADEQQRLLANLILTINLDRKPLPRFWYLPFGKKAAVVMTGDDHTTGGTTGRFDAYKAASPAGCSVANWECVRSTSYVYPGTPITDAQAAAYTADGFEIGLHINTNCGDYTQASLESIYAQQLSTWSAQFPSISAPVTQRHHCIVWSDWSTGAKVQLNHGERLDTSYYFWPPNWVQDRPGFFNGTAMPMRFADLDGTMIDVYEAVTQMTDESGQSYPFTVNTLLDRAVGAEGYYGAYTINAHTDLVDSTASDAAVNAAKSRGLPIVSARQMLNWLDGRNDSAFGAIAWNGTTLSFGVTPGANTNGLQGMVPMRSSNGTLTGITRNGSSTTFTVQTIKGVDYAFFSALAGVYSVTYSGDSTAPSITSTLPANGTLNATPTASIEAVFDEAIASSSLGTSTFELRNASNALISAAVTYDSASRTARLQPTNALAVGASYTAKIKGGANGIKDLAGNPLAADMIWSFSVLSFPCPCSIWNSTATPATPSVVDPGAIELGVKFRAEVAGSITGIRFYKGADNTGTHIGNLWSSTGQLLGTATFANESATGWQQVDFATPIPITANTVYVASYHSDAGNYAFNGSYFGASGVTNSPLYALQSGESGPNGVYKYGPSAFPTDAFQSANYWVDLVFSAGAPPDTTPPTIVTTTPASGATEVGTGTNVTALFNEEINLETVSASTFELRNSGNTLIAASVTYNAANQTATLAPSAALALNTTYTAKIKGGTSGVMDMSGNPLAADVTWSFTTTPGDITPPTVATTTPANAATGVSTGTSITATFNEPVDPATVSASTIELRDASNTLVASSITYDAPSKTLTLAPTASLAANTTYTMKIKGGASGVKDLAGNALAADFTWTFTTISAAACATTTCSIWSTTATPANPAITDANSYELGVKFRSDIAGYIMGIRFYKGSGNTGTHSGNLWSSSGQLLGTATFVNETTTGWQSVTFASPVAIAANTTYIASYHTDAGVFAEDDGYFANAGVVTPPLRALQNNVDGPNGVYRTGASAFPNQTFQSSNYWVDVLYMSALPPDTTPPQVTGQTPANAATGVSVSTNVIATFNEALDPTTVSASTFQLRNSGGTLVSSSVTYDAASKTATLAPSTVLASTATYTATLKGGTSGVKDTAGNALASDVTWSFTTGASGACSNPANPIIAENCLAGNPASEWDISGVGDASIQGYATDISVNRGSTITFKVKTDATNYHLDIYRLGYYAGNGARKVATIQPSASLPQNQPNCLFDSTTKLVDCGNWATSASWAVPATATSGIYIAKLVRADTAGASHIIFIVRDDSSHSDLLFQTSDESWQAYNNYGGYSLYGTSTNEFDQASRAFKVSYNRPFATRGMERGITWVFNAEYPMLRWLEANGYDVSYLTGVDSSRSGSLMLNHKVFMSVGHDEYWAGDQRANVEAARNAGVNLAFFSGNTMFWKTRWENSTDGSNTAYRTLVCYKETHANAKIDPSAEWTGTWRDPRFSPPSNGGRPENAVKGTWFMVNGPRVPADALQVPAADGKMRFWRNTSIATLGIGQTATLPAGTLGYEWDVDVDNGFRPAGLVRMSTTVVNVTGDYLLDYGSNYGNGIATHYLTLYRHSSGALVFDAASVQWSWGLDNNHDATFYSAPPADVRIQQATVNLFADMSVQPATLQAGLVAATASTDTGAPSSTITSPGAGATVPVGSPTTISGTATDVGGGVVGGIEVSVDGGATWHPATGRASWSYTWTPATNGSAQIKSRAADDSGNIETPAAGITVSVGTGDTTAPTVVSKTPASAATNVSLSTNVTATFDEAIDPTTVSASTFELRDAGNTLVAATVTYDAASKTATLTPNTTLANSTTYTANVKGGVGGVEDLAGNPLAADTTWSFTTAAGVDTTAPTVASKTPANAATGVSVGTSVTATFDEAINASTISASTFSLRNPANVTIAATITYDAASKTATLAPTAALATNTTYTATVKGGASGVKDLAGNALAADVTWSFTTAASASITLVGETTIQSNVDGNPAGLAQAFQYTATGSGTSTRIYLYLDSTSSATQVTLGLYSNSASDTPSTLLGQATLASPSNGAWNSVALSGVSIASGSKYWIAVLGPTGSGAIKFRDVASGGGKSPVSSQNNLSTLPASWTSGTSFNNAPMSAYLVQEGSPDTTAPTVAMSAPANGATVAGTAVTVAATASDSGGVASVQFLLDGVALGAADTSTPYSIVWDSTTASNGSHTLSARATDTAGNSATSATVTVTVANADTTAPAQPTGVTATGSATGIALDWANNTETDLAGYNVYRAASAGGPFTKLNASLLATSAYNDTAAPAGVSSFYRITAVDASANESTPATASALRPDATPPAQPTGLTATATGSGIALDWANNSETDLAGYNVYRAASAGGPFTKLNANVLTSSDYEDTLAPTGTSFYQVIAVDTSANASAATTPTSAAMTRANVAINPGFELDANNDGRPDSWTSNASFTRNNTVARSGTYSGRNLSSTNSSYTLTSSAITGLTGSTTYNMTGWVNIPSTADTFTFQLQVRWRNSSNTILRTDTVGTYSAATSGWVKASANLVAPATGTRAEILMVITSLNATIYTDDFALR